MAFRIPPMSVEMLDRSPRCDPRRWRLCLGACLLAASAFAAVGLVPKASGAHSRPTCAGVRAPQVTHRAHIVAKPHGVVVALGARSHKITVATGDKTGHKICGGPGDDTVEGG